MLDEFRQLHSLLDKNVSNRSIGITNRRRDVVLAALEIAIATLEGKPPMTDKTTIDAGVPVVLAFSYQRICDMVTTAIESPVGDWFQEANASAELKRRAMTIAKGRDDNGPWYAVHELYAQSDFQMIVRADNDKGEGAISKTLTMEDFQRALILMATKDDGAYSRHFADFLRGNEDALTADLFMQFAVYGEEVFA